MRFIYDFHDVERILYEKKAGVAPDVDEAVLIECIEFLLEDRRKKVDSSIVSQFWDFYREDNDEC